MKKVLMFLSCLALIGGVSAAPRKAAKSRAGGARKAARDPRIEDINFKGAADGEIRFHFADIARLISANDTDKWVIFKFYEDKERHKNTRAADRALLRRRNNEHADEIAKLYRVNLAHATEKIMNKYNPDVNNGPMYVCYEVQERGDESDSDYVESCLDPNDIHFGTEADAIPLNIEYILSGKNDLADDES